MKQHFNVEFLEEVIVFLDEVEPKAREKIIYNIWKAQLVNDSELFKKLTDEIWEFRTLYNKIHYRLFAFWDKRSKDQTLVIATHGIIKKSGKTPKTEIEKANIRMQLYLSNKNTP